MRAYGAKVIDRNDNPRLFGIVKKIADLNGLPMPRVAIVPSSTPNAFATGRNPKNAVVAATTGIMSVLDYCSPVSWKHRERRSWESGNDVGGYI